tara:strand:+ start:402 stop:806 length:405 start_codon:yes stop_codon:yes gene_type:complete
MRNFKNNFRRNKYKNHSDRNIHRGENGKVLNDFQNGSNFIRKNAGRNNHNAPKLIEKYSNLAREALSNGDKILSENYFQHAEHFIRVLQEKDAHYNKTQSIKKIVNVEEEKNQNQNNANGQDSEELKITVSTES